ncbi:MAG: dihydropteroate synthase [Eubacterium sp.]
MIIVGEKINTSLKGITDFVKCKDTAAIGELAKLQADLGADYIDVNCGTLVDEEREALPWLIKTVGAVVDKPCCIDSPDPVALEAALKCHNGTPMINSITAEEKRYAEMIVLVKEYQAKVVSLLIDDENGISPDAGIRIDIGCRLIEKMTAEGVPIGDIYIDPLVQPISTGADMGKVVLRTIEEIRKRYPGVHFMCGLSNISFGIPERGLLNRTYIAMCMAAGLDGAVLDPTNEKMMSVILAGNALLNQDKACKRYLKAHRKGMLV